MSSPGGSVRTPFPRNKAAGGAVAAGLLVAFWLLCLVLGIAFWGAVIYLLVEIAQSLN